MEDRLRLGPGGSCVCPKCGERVPHHSGVPCQEETCPKCGAKMLRKGSVHFKLWEKKGRKRGSEGPR